MRKNQKNLALESVSDEPWSRGDGIRGSKGGLSTEFFELIFDADEDASNDDYYVTSADFIEFHTRIRRNLLDAIILWLVGLVIAVTVLVTAFN